MNQIVFILGFLLFFSSINVLPILEYSPSQQKHSENELSKLNTPLSLFADYEIDAVNGQTTAVCSGNFYDAGGSGSNYSLDEDYTTTFTASNGGQIQVTFTSFDIENQASCGWDYLRVYDGTSTSGNLFGTYCGTTSPGTITSTTGSLHFVFHSDDVETRPGWAASISCTAPPIGPGSATCVNTTEIGGIVFKDLNANGLNEGEDRVENVTVTLYDDAGIVGSPVTTNGSGEYLFTGLSSSTTYRVEFTVPTDMEESPFNTDSKTSVQFAQPGTCNINLGVFNPSEYCQDNPDFFSVCFVEGEPLGGGSSGTGDVLIAAPTSASGVNPSLLNNLSSNAQTGTVWGLAYQRTTETLFTGAFLKRHAGFGPLGIGGIYTVDYSNPSSPTVTNWLDVNTLAGVNVGANPRNYALPANVSTANNDPSAFDQIGKIGIGDIDISEDDQTLYVMNLNGNGELLILDIATKSLINSVDVPNPGCGSAGDVRPFAIKVYEDEVYIGLVCSGENSGTNDLQFYVMKLSGNAFVPVTDASLNYTKGFVHATYASPPTVCSDWEPWVNNFSDLHSAGSSSAGPRICRPQPILSDIEFDVDGSMVLGFMDRTGHQTGYLQYGISGSTTSNGYTGGDILRVYNNNGTYVLENNGTTLGGGGCGANGQGPGTGEYYCGDFYSNIHEETAHGGLAIQPGTGEVIVSIMDPVNVFSGGIRKLSNSTGQVTDSYQVFQTNAGDAGTFGKAAGLGDLELSCAAAPIEIGNYVWWDDDLDGLMDPSEPGINNVPLELWLDPDGNTQGNNPANGDEILVATTTTDVAGRYIFSYAGNNNGLNAEDWDCANCSGNDNKVLYYETYQVRIPDWNGSGSAHPSGTASGLSANAILESFKNSLATHGPYTAADPIILSPTQTQTNINDSNGYDNPGNDAAAAETGGSGENDHTYDFAFGSCSPPTATATETTGCSGETLAAMTSDDGTATWSIISSIGSTISAGGVVTLGNNTSVTNDQDTVLLTASCSDTIFLTVYPSPILATTGSPTTLCAGDNLNLTSLITGYGSLNQPVWTINSLTGTVESTPTAVSPTTTTTYYLVETNADGCADTTNISVNVVAKPTATASATNPTCSGSTVNSDGTITLAGFNLGERYDYTTGSTYSGSATFASGSTAIPNNGIITNTLSNPSTSQQYTIRIFNSDECYIDRTVTLSETDCTCTNPILTSLTDESICFGNNFTSSNVTTSVTNGIPVTYQWYDNNGTNNSGTANIAGQNTATLTALPTAVGSYSYLVTATSTVNNSCSASEIVNLTIHDNPTVSVANVLKCTSSSETISATASGGTGPYTYVWSGPLADPGNVSSISVNTAGVYTVVITDFNGCTATANGELTFQPKTCLPVSISIKRNSN